MRIAAPLLVFLLAAGGGSALVACSGDDDEAACSCAPDEHCVAGRCVPAGDTDAGPRDADVRDADVRDADVRDADVRDANIRDAGMPDTGTSDAGPCGPGGCGIWVLPGGATTWQQYALAQNGGTYAPSTPIQCAFDIEEHGEAFALTATTYHVLRLSDVTWIRSGARDTIFPEATGTLLNGCTTVPDAHGGSIDDAVSVTLGTVPGAEIYEYDLNARTFTFVRTAVVPGDWGVPLGPERSEIDAAWLDVTNAEGWAVGSSLELCGGGNDFIGPYTGHVANGRVHLNDNGYCFEHFANVPYGDFTPFTYRGAPPASEVTGAFWADGLFILGR